LQSQCAKNGSDCFSYNDQSHCNEIREIFDAKSLKLEHSTGTGSMHASVDTVSKIFQAKRSFF